MKHEIREITVLRALAVLILLLAHYRDYVDVWWLRKIAPMCAETALSIFVFVSGYCLVLGKEITSIKGIFNFLKRKAIRIYSLYIPALVIFSIVFCHNYPNKSILFINHFLSCQLFFANVIEPYFTIWFVGLIVPYYALFALSSYLIALQAKNSVGKHFRHGAANTPLILSILFIVLVVTSVDSIIDPRFVLYLPPFILGIFLSEKKVLRGSKISARMMFSCITLSLLLVLLFYVSKSITYFSACYPMLYVSAKTAFKCMMPLSCLFVVRPIVRNKNIIWKTISVVSYSSFAMFLFHRPLLKVVKVVLSYIQINNTYCLLVLYSFFVFPFILFPISYMIQRSIDRAIAKTSMT